jgi:hypothetical protein
LWEPLPVQFRFFSLLGCNSLGCVVSDGFIIAPDFYPVSIRLGISHTRIISFSYLTCLFLCMICMNHFQY